MRLRENFEISNSARERSFYCDLSLNTALLGNILSAVIRNNALFDAFVKSLKAFGHYFFVLFLFNASLTTCALLPALRSIKAAKKSSNPERITRLKALFKFPSAIRPLTSILRFFPFSYFAIPCLAQSSSSHLADE